ncbi:MAG: hypothetical protein JRJ00_17115 [Deltaproteobacteria bacterium]|nr:hypothetical protein [Deltaproteobacteria bacterium]
MTTKILHVAIDRCIACRACETACGREHNGISHIFVTPIDDKYSIPLSCLHCEKSPCVDVCPTNALEKTSYSAVTFLFCSDFPKAQMYWLWVMHYRVSFRCHPNR